jgi:hypothetical protein
MRTTVELPDSLFRQAKARAALQGRALKDLVADGLKLLLQTPTDVPSPGATRLTKIPDIRSEDPPRQLTPQMVATGEEALVSPGSPSSSRIPALKRGSAGAWARRFAGIARLEPGQTTDDVRMDYHREKHGV